MKKITQFLLATIAFISMVQIVNAQNNASIHGVVTNVKGAPLAGTSVSLFKSGDSLLLLNALTNERGNYEFRNLPGTEYFITFSIVGHENEQSNVFLIGSSQKYQLDTTRLRIISKQLDEIVISSGKRNFIETKMDKIVLNIENSPVAAGASVYEVLEKSPGVYSDKEGNLSMQGKSGVQVLIDGRPTYLSNSDLTNLLKNMQSNEVQSIELITNPSAKYDASGNAGIINIKTKKSKSFGTNGTLTAGGGYGNYLKDNGGLSLNNRSEKLNLFGNYNYSFNKNSRNLAIDREATKDGVTTLFSQDGKQVSKLNSHFYKLGADYNLNKNNLIGFLINGNESHNKQHSVNTTLMGEQKDVTDSSLFADNNFKRIYSNNSVNLNFRSTLNEKGAELAMDADYSKYNSVINSLFLNDYFNAAGEKLKDSSVAKNSTSSAINIKSLKVDYTNPVSNSLKLETGAKMTMIRSDNGIRYEALKGKEWKNDTSKSNRFLYDENVLAAYVNASKQWENTSMQAGMRVEYSDTKGNSLTENKIVKRDYLDFFPSVFINQKLSASHSIGLSYSRRIQRPDYESLNPFVYNVDDYTYEVGNPFLNPEYNQSFELNYFFKNKYMAQFGYTTTRDMISEVILADTAKKALYQTIKNIDNQKIYRLTISAPFQVTQWWKVSNNFNGINIHFKSSDLEGQALNTAQFFVILNSNHNFKIQKNFTAELNAKYTSPMVYGTLQLQSEFSMDAGLSKSVFGKKGNLKMSVSDFLNTKNQRVSSVYPGVHYILRQKQETRVFRLSFTYRFGNSNVKESPNRKTGLEEEQSRLKSGN